MQVGQLAPVLVAQLPRGLPALVESPAQIVMQAIVLLHREGLLSVHQTTVAVVMARVLKHRYVQSTQQRTAAAAPKDTPLQQHLVATPLHVPQIFVSVHMGWQPQEVCVK